MRDKIEIRPRPEDRRGSGMVSAWRDKPFNEFAYHSKKCNWRWRNETQYSQVREFYIIHQWIAVITVLDSHNCRNSNEYIFLRCYWNLTGRQRNFHVARTQKNKISYWFTCFDLIMYFLFHIPNGDYSSSLNEIYRILNPRFIAPELWR